MTAATTAGDDGGRRPEAWSRREVALLLGFTACLLLCLRGALAQRWICDDALIDFRYVDNVVAGHGLVYNLGERLESFSSPLWIALLLPARLLGASPFVTAELLGVAATIVELALIFALLGRYGRLPVVALIAGGLFASDRVVQVWATGGLETALYAALVFASFHCSALQLRRDHATTGLATTRATTRATWAGVVHLLLAAARPEGVVFFAVYLGSTLAVFRGRERVRQALAPALRATLIVGGGVVGLLALRYAYYGALLPHTYAAKLAGVPVADFGRGYLKAFALREGFLGVGRPPLAWLLVLAAFVTSVVVARRAGPAPIPSAARDNGNDNGHDNARELARVAAVGAIYVGVGALVTGFEGGDYMTDFRFMRPIMGVMFATAAALLGHGLLARTHRRAQLVSALAAVVLFVAHAARQLDPTPVFADAPSPAVHKANNATSAREAAEFRAALLRFAEPGDAILTDTTGYKGYGHTLRTVDATGLTSPTIAGNFYLRPAWATETYRDRLPGHARWPKVEFLRAEGFALITPKISREGPEVPEITERSHRRYRRYRFLHVTLALGDGEFLRFFTTLSADALMTRAIARDLDLCWRAPMQTELHCAQTEAATHEAEHPERARPQQPAGIEATQRAVARSPSDAVRQYFGAMRAADCEWLRATTAGAQAELDAQITCAQLSAQLEHMGPVRLWSLEAEQAARDPGERLIRARFFLEGKDRVKTVRVRAIEEDEWRVTEL